MKTSAFLSAAVLIGACAISTLAGQKLMVIGGNGHSDEAIARFVRWSGGPKASILVISWAGTEPEISFANIRKDFAAAGAKESIPAVSSQTAMANPEKFLSQLTPATGVYFTGGDQVWIMNVLKNPALMGALRKRYSAGTPFGGTSAGAAIMSPIMITGEGDFTVIDAAKVETREGLGLLPGAIVDQHFIKQRRENRLFGLILAHPDLLGLGIDETTALAVEDNRWAQVLGPNHVLAVTARSKAGLLIELLNDNDRYDILERKKLP